MSRSWALVGVGVGIALLGCSKAHDEGSISPEDEARLDQYRCGSAARNGRAEAVELCTPLCEAGDGLSCTALGNIHRTGSPTVPADPAQAQVHYHQGCSLGEVMACEVLEPGAEAVELQSVACLEHPDPAEAANVCTKAGLAWLDGIGVAVDRDRAEALLDKGCRGGNMDACDAFEIVPPGT